MPTVSCPTCATDQNVETTATSYTCTSCGTSWDLVVCSSCGSRYHAKPGSPRWTCPNCGTVNGSAVPAATSATMSVSGDDLDSVPPEGPGGPQQPFGSTEPGSAFPMPQADRPGGFPRWALALIAVAVVAIIAVVLLTRGGDEEPASPAPNADAAITALCTHVQQLTQLLRDDSLGRAQDTIRQDAAAIREAGDAATAKQVKVLIARIQDLRVAYQEQGDTADASAAMGKAIAALPC
jgi:hypothetical protein